MKLEFKLGSADVLLRAPLPVASQEQEKVKQVPHVEEKVKKVSHVEEKVKQASHVEEKVKPVSQEKVMQVTQMEGESQQVTQVIEPSQSVLYQVQKQQKENPELAALCLFQETRMLPDDLQQAKVISNLAKKDYFLVDNVFYYERACTGLSLIRNSRTP